MVGQLQLLCLRCDARGERLHDLLETVALALDGRQHAAHVHRRPRRLPRGTWSTVRVRVRIRVRVRVRVWVRVRARVIG